MEPSYIDTTRSSNYTRVELIDGDNDRYGFLYLYSPTQPVSIPSPPNGSPFPGPVSQVTDFPDLFTSLADTIGQQLAAMNNALVTMHNRGAGNSVPQDALTQYMLAADRLLIRLSLKNSSEMGQRNKYWPLVPFNDGNKAFTPQQSLVSTADLGNDEYPDKPGGTPDGLPDHKNALYFKVPTPDDNSRFAIGSIVFFQDCEWDPNNSNDNKRWCSWGFVTNFSLTLFEEISSSSGMRPAAPTGLRILGDSAAGGVAVAPQRQAVRGISSSSSSSSSYYAASSSMPGK